MPDSNSQTTNNKKRSPSHKGKKRKQKSSLAVILSVFIIFGIAIASAYATYSTHMAKARQIEDETARLMETLHEMELRRETLEGMIEYTESEEYLLRYAREYLGYMFEDDIRIDVDNPDAPIPTAVLPLVTARPTATPNPTDEPNNLPADTLDPVLTEAPIETTEPGSE